MQVILAENAGTCYGVERALNIAHKVTEDARHVAFVDDKVDADAHRATDVYQVASDAHKIAVVPQVDAHKVAGDAQFQQVNTSNPPQIGRAHV